MKVIGITGGIASGKTTVSNILRELNIPVIDADIIARKIVEKGKPALEEIKKEFGKEVILSDGNLNRKHLAKIVFSDSEQLNKLNRIMHKRILKEMIDKIDSYKASSYYTIVFVDVALLIETNMKLLVDEIWLVSLNQDIQLKRLVKRDQIDEIEALKKIQSQMSLEEKKKFADVIIDNSKDFEHLKKQVMKELNRLFGGI